MFCISQIYRAVSAKCSVSKIQNCSVPKIQNNVHVYSVNTNDFICTISRNMQIFKHTNLLPTEICLLYIENFACTCLTWKHLNNKILSKYEISI
jgi:hypothetical protein